MAGNPTVPKTPREVFVSQNDESLSSLLVEVTMIICSQEINNEISKK